MMAMMTMMVVVIVVTIHDDVMMLMGDKDCLMIEDQDRRNEMVLYWTWHAMMR